MASSPDENEPESSGLSEAAEPSELSEAAAKGPPLRPPKVRPLALVVLGLFLLAGVGVLLTALLWQPDALPQHTKTPAEIATLQAATDAGSASAFRVDRSFATDLDTANGQNLLATQSEQKRNQILVIDLYGQILQRYPDAREQRAWFGSNAKNGQALEHLRDRAASEEDVANYIAGVIFEEPTVRARAPAIKMTGANDDVLVAAATVARAVHYRPDIPLGEDQRLVHFLSHLQAGGATAAPAPTNALAPMKDLLTAITGSTDIGEHFVEDANDDLIEQSAMRTLLRGGKLLVLNGSDGAEPPRYLVVVGFDRRGDFLVRDPAGKLPETVKGDFIMAFLRHPGLLQPGTRSGFWLDVPGKPTRVKCVSHEVAVKPALPPPEPTPELAWNTTGVTGVIPGAQVNLTSMRIPPGEHSLRGTMSITAERIDEILTRVRSPAAGNGHNFVKYGVYYNIDPIFALAFFRKESVYGTHPRWIGQKGGGENTRNIGNIRYVGRPNPQRIPQYGVFNGFRDYSSWEDGIHDWFKLIAQDSNYAGLHTVEAIIPKYAPSFENDTNQYLKDVVKWVGEWRQQALATEPVRATPEPVAAQSVAEDLEVDCRSAE